MAAYICLFLAVVSCNNPPGYDRLNKLEKPRMRLSSKRAYYSRVSSISKDLLYGALEDCFGWALFRFCGWAAKDLYIVMDFTASELYEGQIGGHK